MTRKKSVIKKTATRKLVGRKTSKSGNKHAPVRKVKTTSKQHTAKPTQLKIVPVLTQTLAQLENDLSKREKKQSQLVKKLGFQLKKAESNQEKANKKLNGFQQKAEGKEFSASKLKSLEKAVNIAKSACAAVETELFKAKHVLKS
jgi:ABC-type Fe2+-enterobactin transport system substrate-binding protein